MGYEMHAHPTAACRHGLTRRRAAARASPQAHSIFSGFGKFLQRCSPTLEDGNSPHEMSNRTETVVVRVGASCLKASADGHMGLLPDSFFSQHTLYGPPVPVPVPSSTTALITRPTKPSQRDRLRLDRYDEQESAMAKSRMQPHSLLT